MRIAVVNWTNRIAGGAERYLDVVVSGLGRLGHDLVLWHEISQPSERSLIDPDSMHGSICVETRGLEEARRLLVAWAPDVIFMHRLDNVDHQRMLRDIAPTVFLSHDYYGTCISGTKAFGFPVIRPCGQVFGAPCLVRYFPRRCGGLSPLTMVRAYRTQTARLELLRGYQAIVTLSEHMRQEYIRHGLGEGVVHRLPPIDTSLPSLAARRPSPSDPGDKRLRLAFIGRLDRVKGCDLLIRALRAVQSAVGTAITLTIAGDGPALDRCRRLADTVKDANIEIVFCGWVSATDTATLLANADALVVPSVWPEPLGLVGYEARRHGVPVAAFAVGGIPEWLEDGVSGALAPADPPTTAGLASAIVRCVTEPGLRQRSAAGATEMPALDVHLQAVLARLAYAAGTSMPTSHSAIAPAVALT